MSFENIYLEVDGKAVVGYVKPGGNAAKPPRHPRAPNGVTYQAKARIRVPQSPEAVLLPHRTALPSTAFNGWLNDTYNTNCRDCRDSVGHFCKELVQCATDGQLDCSVGAEACASSTALCVGDTFNKMLLGNSSGTIAACPNPCQQYQSLTALEMGWKKALSFHSGEGRG